MSCDFAKCYLHESPSYLTFFDRLIFIMMMKIILKYLFKLFCYVIHAFFINVFYLPHIVVDILSPLTYFFFFFCYLFELLCVCFIFKQKRGREKVKALRLFEKELKEDFVYKRDTNEKWHNFLKFSPSMSRDISLQISRKFLNLSHLIKNWNEYSTWR